MNSPQLPSKQIADEQPGTVTPASFSDDLQPESDAPDDEESDGEEEAVEEDTEGTDDQPPILRDPDERRPEIPDTIFPFDTPTDELFVRDPGDDQPFAVLGTQQVLPATIDTPPRTPNTPVGGDFFPVDDRWRLGFPYWDRWAYSGLTNPYRASVFKGDLPLVLENHDNIFFEFTGFSDSFFVVRDRPRNVAGAIRRGNVNERVFQETVFTTFDIFKHDNTVIPSPWFLSFTPAFRFIDPSFAGGSLDDVALQTAFLDYQLAITSEYYDQRRLIVGRQAFASDFLGFVFADANDAVRLFWTKDAVRTFGNIVFFNQVQKDAASNFNTFASREQQVAIASLQRNDFIFPGFNVLASFVYNNDSFRQNVDAYWFELAWGGRLGRFDVQGAAIQALGTDSMNPIAGRQINANAQLLAAEFALPLDWFRPKVSALYASGDKNPSDGVGRGFDSVFDNPNFAGNGFSYINREAMAIGGQTIFNAFSFLPNMRGKAAAPSNFVNPGLVILNAGVDAVMTTRLQALVEFNYFQFVHTEPLEARFGVANVPKKIGLEASVGLVYKPFIVDNLVITAGASVLDPGAGITTLSGSNNLLYTSFGAVTVIY